MNLSAWMVAAGLTNAALAKKLGVAENTVNRWRNRWRRPREKVMAQIHEVSGGQVAPNDFFVVEDKPRTAAKRALPPSGKDEAVHRGSRLPALQRMGSAQ
jgi:transcriptional regulator with XRE-family HTH domain